MLSCWLIYILSQRLVPEVCKRCDWRCFRSFCRCDQSQEFKLVWIEFVRLIAATKFCRSDKECRKNAPWHTRHMLQRFVTATYCSDLSPRVSRPLACVANRVTKSHFTLRKSQLHECIFWITWAAYEGSIVDLNCNSFSAPANCCETMSRATDDFCQLLTILYHIMTSSGCFILFSVFVEYFSCL